MSTHINHIKFELDNFSKISKAGVNLTFITVTQTGKQKAQQGLNEQNNGFHPPLPIYK